LPLSIDEITPPKGSRTLILGSSRSGKSVLGDHIHFNLVRTRPRIEIAMADTKPRYRAELERFGPRFKFARDAAYHYADWEKGPTIPGSYRHPLSVNDMSFYWGADPKKDPMRTVILQTERDDERARILEILDDKWFSIPKRGADRVLRINELLDFYYGNGVCISSRHNVPLKVNRAGGERGFSGIYESQRARGFPLQLVEEATDVFLFHLKYMEDMKFLWANGIPRDIVPPGYEVDDNADPEQYQYLFKWIQTSPGGRATYRGLFKLRPEEWYMEQLSET